MAQSSVGSPPSSLIFCNAHKTLALAATEEGKALKSALPSIGLRQPLILSVPVGSGHWNSVLPQDLRIPMMNNSFWLAAL